MNRVFNVQGVTFIVQVRTMADEFYQGIVRVVRGHDARTVTHACSPLRDTEAEALQDAHRNARLVAQSMRR